MQMPGCDMSFERASFISMEKDSHMSMERSVICQWKGQSYVNGKVSHMSMERSVICQWKGQSYVNGKVSHMSMEKNTRISFLCNKDLKNFYFIIH